MVITMEREGEREGGGGRERGGRKWALDSERKKEGERARMRDRRGGEGIKHEGGGGGGGKPRPGVLERA